MNYFKLTPIQKIKLGYITWTDNFRINHGEVSFLGKHYILFISFLRFLFNYPVSFQNIKDLKLNISQLNVDKL